MGHKNNLLVLCPIFVPQKDVYLSYTKNIAPVLRQTGYGSRAGKIFSAERG